MNFPTQDTAIKKFMLLERAWTILSPCDGTLAPTSSPTCFIPGASCTSYTKLVGKTSAPIHVVIIPVTAWSSGTLYEAGDQVWVGSKKFEHKPWPYYLWCCIAAYMPTDLGTGLWTEAWKVAVHAFKKNDDGMILFSSC